MILTLEGEKLVDRVDRGGVGGVNPELGAPGKCVGRVRDPVPTLRHDGGAGDRAVMHEAGQGEISALEGAGDHSHVASDLGGAGGVVPVPLKDDTAAIGERFEAMGGGVLIHAHGHVSARLNSAEGAVG